MIAEGRVSITLQRQGGRPPMVAFSQPGDIGRLLAGKTPAEALAVIPSVYALCGMAQAHAAVTAIESALQIESTAVAARQALTDMETLRENALRVVLDWPRLVGDPVVAAGVRPLMGLVPQLRGALFGNDDAFEMGGSPTVDHSAVEETLSAAETVLEDAVFGEPLSVWRERIATRRIEDWIEARQTPAARLLARVTERGWRQAGAVPLVPLVALDAAALQAWLDTATGDTLPGDSSAIVPETTLLSALVAEQSAVTASYGESPGLHARLLARLLCLAALPINIAAAIAGDRAATSGQAGIGGTAGFGASVIPAARGMLIHAVECQSGRIARYRILPPTRWNFDAAGVATRALGAIADRHPDDVAELADLMVNAIDPCVGYEVRLH